MPPAFIPGKPGNPGPAIRRAVYPGSFDPPTRGHGDIALRAAAIFDELIIAVSGNSAKNPLFTIEERMDMLKTMFADQPNIQVATFPGLLVDYVNAQQASAIVRGLRAVSDFEYELQMASLNSHLNPSAETVFFMASDENLFVSSSIVKEITRLGGDISQKVHPYVWQKLKEKFQK